LTSLPRDYKSVECKLVFRIKRDTTSLIVRHDARLIAKQYFQIIEIDFNETFALIAKCWSCHEFEKSSNGSEDNILNIE